MLLKGWARRRDQILADVHTLKMVIQRRVINDKWCNVQKWNIDNTNINEKIFFEGTASSTSGNIGEQEPQYFGLKSIFCIEEIYSQDMQY